MRLRFAAARDDLVVNQVVGLLWVLAALEHLGGVFDVHMVRRIAHTSWATLWTRPQLRTPVRLRGRASGAEA